MKLHRLKKTRGALLSLGLLLCGVFCCKTDAQQHVAKSFTLGDLIYLEASEPCGWLCFDRQIAVEREGKRVYIRPEKVGVFKVAALSKSSVGDVEAYYTITITGSPGPGPEPPGPGPQPIPNKYGVGKTAYDSALSIEDKASIRTCIDIWRAARVQMIDAYSDDAEDAVYSRINNESNTKLPSPQWKAWRIEVKKALNASYDSELIDGSKEKQAAAIAEIIDALEAVIR